MDTGSKRFMRFLHEGIQAVEIVFVSRRHDFHHGDHLVVADMADRDRFRLGSITVGLRGHPDADPGRHDGKGDAPSWRRDRLRRAIAPRPPQGQDIRSEAPGNLLGQGVIVGRQQAAVQGAGDLGNPVVVKSVKNARINTRPVVNRHGFFLAFFITVRDYATSVASRRVNPGGAVSKNRAR
jgi:hypothetical protein